MSSACRFNLDEQGVIEDIAFVNSGCSISTASASMMTDVVLGEDEGWRLALAEIFSQMVQGEDKQQQELGDAALLAGVAKSLNASAQPWVGTL